MKSCVRCFEYLYVFVGGDVRCCPWNHIVVGNLLESTLEEIWRGPKIEEIRHAFMRGELLGCDEMYCPGCINYEERVKIHGEIDKSYAVLSGEPVKWISKEELQQRYDSLSSCPLQISLAYDNRCNHVCPSCRCEYLIPDDKYKSNLKIITDNIEPYLSNVKSIASNGIGELFVSNEILNMLSRLKPKHDELTVFIETNGVLFKDNWDKLKHLSQYHFTVSVTPNSFHRETYRYLAGKDDLEKFEESMAFISDLKNKGSINHIRMIMVIQDSNFRQIPEFIHRCIEFNADDIVLRPIFNWFGLKEDEWLYKNVLNSYHPYHNDYLEVLKNPICKDPRVYNWGFIEKQEPESFPTLEMKRFYLNTVPRWEERLSDLIPFLEKYDNIIIYGAGHYGSICIEELLKCELKNKLLCVAVSSEENNADTLCGFPVRGIDKLLKHIDNSAILIATMHNIAKEIRCTLESYGFKHIVELF